ncbi:Hpt domain-containing protein [Comamonas aquatica]|uniref:Hpt domain-containing protein n=1 Tax=Comamonas aquatica TaxID=225991 RepID=UPI0022DD5BED|nr:Hpt domain-containing protein [Comamonas aquatica]MDH1901517.1 Hpt domain-containing protein [Comamonas aquatica]WBM41451.1 Hpt domain-containing protein [Comamonas aquatica]
MSPTEATAPIGHVSQSDRDLGPLAWVLDELRKSMDAAVKATRRFVREAEEARDSDLAALDSSPLRMAKQQLHQSSGALDMVGMPQAALLLRAMETAMQHYVQQPADCTEAVALTLEKASFALLEFLESVLAGKPVSAVALFPQYRDVQALFGNHTKVHPADLWPVERRLRDPALPYEVSPLGYGPEPRKVLDTSVLQIVKGSEVAPAGERMREICLGFAQAQTDVQMRIFWKVAAAFFDAMAHGLLKPDIYTKRVASRLLTVSAALAKSDPVAPERLLQDMLFFCAQAAQEGHPGQAAAVVWRAVHEAFDLQRHAVVNYEQPRFGRFDPHLLAQARKRIATATEVWSALAGGDVQKCKPAVDQFTLVCDSLVKLHPGSLPLARALMQVVHSVATQAQSPSPEVAMEVATAVLYLQAAFASLDIADDAMASHADTLAGRLLQVQAGQPAQPLEPWMEQLYRQVSDQQTMGSVVGELRGTLADAEKLLDQYFRNPADTAVLAPVAAHLSQMRGVLSVLGLDQASQAMVRMRQNVERLQTEQVPEDEQHRLFDKMGNSLGALGFLIDMLSYQRNLARKLYEFDEQEGELKLLMGRVRPRASDGDGPAAREAMQAREPQSPPPVELAVPQTQLHPQVALAAAPEAVQPPPTGTTEESVAAVVQPVADVQAVAVPAPALQVQPDDTDEELLGIFLEEAREVVANGRTALQALAEEPSNLSEQTVLRRAFHTLKGSSRMVGLDDFGQAGWAMEQMLNAWLAEQKAMPEPMRQLSGQALDAFEAWVAAIEAQADQHWQSAPFRASADAMRLGARFIPLDRQAVQGAAATEVAPPVAEVDAAQWSAAQALDLEDLTATAPALTEDAEAAAPAAFDSLDVAALSGDVPVTAEAAAPLVPEALTEAWAEESAAALEEPEARAMEVPQAEEISFDEFDALLHEAGDGISAPILPVAPSREEVVEPVEASAEAGRLEDVAATAELELEPELTLSGVDEVPAAPADISAADAAPSEPPAAQVKQIGDLSVPLPLFNVYLSEAEGWSYRLLDALTAWQENLEEAQPDSVIAWAHSLAGSSATVGFQALSGLARKLEAALQHVEPQACGVAEQVQVFVQAAEEIRGLLHQFAAGFLRTASADVQQRLQEVLQANLELAPAPVAAQAPAEVDEPLPQAAAVAQERSAPLLPPSDAAMPQAVVDGDDDIDVFDVIDPDLFPIFEEEAVELLPVLGAAMREWAGHPTRLEARSTLLRALHTLKGSARLAGALRLGEMAHRLESALEALDVDTVTTEQIEPLFGRLDSMEASFGLLRAVGEQAPETPVSIEPVASSLEGALSADAVPPATAAQPQVADVVDAAPAPAVVAQPVAVPPEAPPPALAGGVRQGVQQTVRVRAQLLDRLINEAGEVMIARSRLDERVGSIKHSLNDLTHNLERLRHQLRDIEVQAESQMQSRMQLSKEAGADFDPLEFDRFTRVQELTRMMAESVNDVATVQRNLLRDVAGAEDDLVAQGRQARELQRDLLRTRMVEFDAISERLYAVVRLTAKETGKQVKLGLSGGTIEMDRGVLERMVPAFEHLLRNCVDHGIETPEERVAAGKPATGSIQVHVQQEGNDVAVCVSDDGAGLNVARIRDKALERGLITAEETVDAARAAQLVFMPGFTTAEQLTGVSGRGIGMDVVRSEVQALGGRIETVTQDGQGSSFRLVLPLTTAVTQVVMLRAGEFSVGVPASLVEVVRRVSLADLEAAYRTGELVDGEDRVPFFWAGAVWSQSPRSLEVGAGKTRPVVICRSASQRIALHVDEVLGHQEVVVKHLGAQMSRLPGLTGMSVLASGAVVLIYNPVALTAVYGAQIRQLGAGLPALLDAQAAQQLQHAMAPQAPLSGMQAASQVPLVMVVDDSITVRRVSQRLLQREGYRVVTAADGLQALEQLQEELPCVVLSDIEMPRMDGFDLLRNIRAQARLQHLPIIMITSRMAQKHRDLAMELGANHYLGKPYSDEELMGLVHHYAVGKPLPLAAESAGAEAVDG